ncbi:MAG: hypothetical protein ACKVP3_17185 [Hyphomicrobiaceae bacterium]
MNRKLAAARALVRNSALPLPERRRQLNQLTVDVRHDYDQQISQIRSNIAAIGMSTAHVVWRAVVNFLTRAPTGGTTGAAAIAKLRVKLAELHTAKFAALAELKLLKALS